MNNYNLWRQELFNIIYISINANTKMIYCSISTLAIILLKNELIKTVAKIF